MKNLELLLLISLAGCIFGNSCGKEVMNIEMHEHKILPENLTDHQFRINVPTNSKCKHFITMSK